MCQICLSPAAVLQTGEPLGMGSNDFGTTLTCPFSTDSNVSDSKSEKETNQGKREKMEPAFQDISLFWLSRNSGELTDHLNCLKATALCFKNSSQIRKEMQGSSLVLTGAWPSNYKMFFTGTLSWAIQRGGMRCHWQCWNLSKVTFFMKLQAKIWKSLSFQVLILYPSSGFWRLFPKFSC